MSIDPAAPGAPNPRGRMKRKRLLIGSLLLFPLFLAVLVAAGDDEPEEPVRVEAVARRDLFATVTGSGMILPRNKVDVSADIPGRVTRVAVEEGDWVRKGDLLVQIDAERLQSSHLRAQASVAQAEAAAEQVRANLVQAESSLARAEQLAGTRGWVTRQELETQRSQVAAMRAQLRSSEFAVAQARAGMAEARDVMDKTTIFAPMSGRVTRLNIHEGEMATVGSANNPGSLLLTIADLGEMEARIRVDETDVPRIALGDRAMVRIDAFPRRAFPGRVVRVSNSASRGGGQASAHFQVVIALDSTDVPLHPELSANADVVTDERRGVLAIPILALTARDRHGMRLRESAAGREAPTEGVFVVDEDGEVRWTPVRVGIVGKQHFEVTEGLRGGETVVAGSYQRVRELEDGDFVDAAPVEEGDDAPARAIPTSQPTSAPASSATATPPAGR